MTTTQKQRREITGGPSREELFDALRLRHEGREVPFTLSPPEQKPDAKIKVLSDTLKLKVNGIDIEDGSGESWTLKLYDPHAILGSNRLKAYFSTKRRKGWIQAK